MRAAPDPRAALLEFLQTTYEAGATLAKWDRPALERPFKLARRQHFEELVHQAVQALAGSQNPSEPIPNGRLHSRSSQSKLG